MSALSASTPPVSAASPRLNNTPAEAAPRRVATVQSADLLQGQKALEIQHNGSIYRLQATKLGKLILTK